MADLHKTLILVHIEELPTTDDSRESLRIDGTTTTQTLRSDTYSESTTTSTIATTLNAAEPQLNNNNSKIIHYPCNDKSYSISELTITTEHAPFRQHQQNNSSKVT